MALRALLVGVDVGSVLVIYIEFLFAALAALGGALALKALGALGAEVLVIFDDTRAIHADACLLVVALIVAVGVSVLGHVGVRVWKSWELVWGDSLRGEVDLQFFAVENSTEEKIFCLFCSLCTLVWVTWPWP